MKEQLAQCNTPVYWHNCYSGGFSLWSDIAYSHPAKMSPALCYRILQHLQELGLVKEGDTILDPMAGIGTTNICAGALGYKSISVELEDKFVNFEKQNREYAERRLYKPLDWEIIQGDSRDLSLLLQGKGLKSITSPPYENALPNGLDRKAAEQLVQAMYDKHGRTYSKKDFEYQVELMLKRSNREYGESEGQIGVLKDKPLKVITSPPYSEAQTGGGISKLMRGEGSYDNAIHSGSGEWSKRALHNNSNLHKKPLIKSGLCARLSKSQKGYMIGGELSNGGKMLGIPQGEDYIKAEGSISSEKGESYLEAMQKVYSEIAKVSDVLVVVVKNPTRNGKLRRLDLDTISILEASGWKIFCQHRALLFEELEQADLFEGSKKQVKGRLSFFKRLSWQNGQPVASWEDILVCTRI